MRFHIGPFTYTLRIPAAMNPPTRLGEANADTWEILLNASIVPAHRIEILLHELTHCWQFHFPRPRTDEECADLNATIFAATMADLERQGGAAALERMRAEQPEPEFVPVEDEVPPQAPDDTWLMPHEAPLTHIHRSQCVARSNAERCACQQCGMTVAGGSVATSPARYDAECHGFIVERRLYCGHCDHVMVWKEGATPEGHPNGSLVGEPEYRRGKEVEDFLTKHPEAAAVVA